MAGRRIVGLLVLLVIIIAVAFVIWYIGSQKTVYDIMLSYQR
jgi:ABC-type transporter Mla subunit MlaD